MTMANPSSKRGFSLIELLTVIAIISVLAAIIFPLGFAVREQARESDCMSKLHQLWISAMVYKQDEGAFPPTLLGYAEAEGYAATDPRRAYIGDSGQTAVPLDRLTGSYLYKQQIKDAGLFQSPNANRNISRSTVTVAHFPPRPASWPADQAWVGDQLASLCPSDEFGTVDCYNELTPPLVQSTDVRYHQPKYYYAWDSYSTSPRVDATGNPVLDSLGRLVYDVRYSVDWTGKTGLDTSTKVWDMSNQLKYAEPPSDKTLFAMTTWHVVTARVPRVTAISMAGAAKKFKIDQVLPYNANVYSQGQ